MDRGREPGRRERGRQHSDLLARLAFLGEVNSMPRTYAKHPQATRTTGYARTESRARLAADRPTWGRRWLVAGRCRPRSRRRAIGDRDAAGGRGCPTTLAPTLCREDRRTGGRGRGRSPHGIRRVRVVLPVLRPGARAVECPPAAGRPPDVPTPTGVDRARHRVRDWCGAGRVRGRRVCRDRGGSLPSDDRRRPPAPRTLCRRPPGRRAIAARRGRVRRSGAGAAGAALHPPH